MRYLPTNRYRKLILASILIGILLISGMLAYSRRALFTSSQSNRSFNAGVIGSLEELHPARLQNQGQLLAASAIYEGLVAYDEKKQSIVPLIARKWKYYNDGKSLVIHLKRNVQFSNGKNLTASDIKSSWERNLAAIQEPSDLNLFLVIEGTRERLQGKSPDISGIKVINDHTLKITFTRPNYVFLKMLVNPLFWLLDISDPQQLPIGTGPYILKEKSPTEIIMLPNDLYHRGSPYLSALKIISFEDEKKALDAYQKGNLDYLDALPLPDLTQLRENAEYSKLLIDKPLLEVYWLGMNLNREPYDSNYLLRRALNYGINRESIIKDLIGPAYTPMRGVIPSGLPGFNKNRVGYAYQPEKAGQLLAEAGFPQGEKLKPLTLSYNQDAGHQLIAGEISRQLSALGVTVNLQQYDWEYFKKELTRMGTSFFRLGWQADYPDTDNFLYSLFHSSRIGTSNFTGYNNPQVDKLLDASRAEFDDKDRLELLSKAEKIILDDAPCLWLFQKKAIKLLGKDVQGFNIDNMQRIDWYKVKLSSPQPESEKSEADDSKGTGAK